MEKIVITPNEVDCVEIVAGPLPKETRLPPAIPLWAKLSLIPIVLVLPLLCLFAIILRIALRATAPRTREAWNSYLNTLFVASGALSTVFAVLLFSYSPQPPQSISAGISDLDERISFPALPSTAKMAGTELAETLKPLVMVASPAQKRWFSGASAPSGLIGAALLLQSNNSGYLFATARHVANGLGSSGSGKILLTSGLGGWASADVVARHKDMDVALLWIPRHSGHAEFHQPIASAATVKPGESVYVIGHPEGLNFTITNGIVSRMSRDILQISAPISPGNSGGPVYDERGTLLGVVSSKMDRAYAPNAENLNFAVNADVFTRIEGWQFSGSGEQQFKEYLRSLSSAEPSVSTK